MKFEYSPSLLDLPVTGPATKLWEWEAKDVAKSIVDQPIEVRPWVLEKTSVCCLKKVHYFWKT